MYIICDRPVNAIEGDWVVLLDSDGGWVANPQRKARAVEVPRTHLEPSLWHSSTLLSVPPQTQLNSLSEPELNPNLLKIESVVTWHTVQFILSI